MPEATARMLAFELSIVVDDPGRIRHSHAAVTELERRQISLPEWS